MNYKKRHAVFEGVDFCGKGTAINAIIEFEKSRGTKVFDLDEYQKKHGHNPTLEEIPEEIGLVVYSEPTWCIFGRVIRSEIIANNKRDYTGLATAEAYALDRRVLFENFLGPLLENRKDMKLLGSRSLVSSLVYQAHQMKMPSFRAMMNILKISGNNFVWTYYLPGLLGINIVDDTADLIRRKELRKEKVDDSIFEDIKTLTELSKLYKSRVLKEMLKNEETSVVYIDTSKSVEETGAEAVKVWKKYLLESV